MMIPGELRREGSCYSALVEALGAYTQGRSRESACEALAATVLDIASDHGMTDLEVTVTDDGESTVYVTARHPRQLVALLLRCQRAAHELSLADVAAATGAKSRNTYAQYEHGRTDPSITKLQELLDAVAPSFAVAVIPRTARVIPRWDEEADDATEIEALLREPSPANAAALRHKRPSKPAPTLRARSRKVRTACKA